MTDLVEQPQLLPEDGLYRAGCAFCTFEVELPDGTVSFGVQHTCRPRGALVVWPSARIETHSEEAA